MRALLARGTEGAAREAADEVARLLALYEARHDPLRMVELLALQALAHQELGAPVTALDALGRALALAEPAGRIRVFMDLGDAMGRLLALYAVRRGASPYLERLLAACGDATGRGAPPTPAQAPTSLPLVEPLTRREIEVLRLLEARRTNEEIARSLCVSPATVKKHTMNLYQKLHGSGRRHAVAQATALGLLSPLP